MPVSAFGPWRVRVLGETEVSVDGTPLRLRTRKTTTLFALLGAWPGRTWTRDRLADLLWPDQSSEAARQSLRMALSDIRKHVGDYLSAERDVVTLTGGSSDLSEFEERVARHGDGSDAERLLLGEALALVQGPLTFDLDLEWLTPEQARINELVAAATVRYVDLCAETGAYQAGHEAGRKALARIGVREPIYLALMRLALAQGVPSEVLALYEELERALDEELGECPSAAAGALLESAPGAPATRSVSTFVGREGELRQIQAFLAEHRPGQFLSLHGVGGAGKTTLALRAAELSGWDYCFVDLSQDGTAADALRRTMVALGLRAGEAGEAVSLIAQSLSERPRVLVLDNIEQLVPDQCGFVSSLAGSLTSPLVVTTRVLTGADGEVALGVGGLALPGGEDVSESPAVQLFVQRAALARPDFQLTTANSGPVRDLVESLDGLPLGLELAASLSDALSPGQIRAQLGSNLGLLAQGSPDRRHASLEAILASTYARLPDSSRTLARRLALLHTYFGPDDGETLEGSAQDLVNLVRASLISPAKEESFGMSIVIQTYLRGQDPDLADVQAHFEWACSRAKAMAEAEFAHDGERAAALLEMQEDLIAAITAAADLGFAPERLAQVLSDLEGFSLETVAHRLEPVLRAVLDAVPDDERFAPIAATWGKTADNLATPEEMLSRLNRAAAWCSSANPCLPDIRYRLGSAYKGMAKYEEARAEYEWVLASGTDDPWQRARALYNLGRTACCQGLNEESLAFHMRALSEVRKCQDLSLRVRILFDAGSELAAQGRGEESLPYFAEAIEHCTTLGSIKLEGLTRWQLGDALVSMNRAAEALQELIRSTQLVLKASFSAGLKWIFLKTSEALWRTDHRVLATQMLAWLLQEREKANRPLAQYEKVVADQLLNEMREHLGAYNFQRYTEEGESATYSTFCSELAELVQ